jgi:predicted lipoprotein with Yx(FWY)xxD motif
MAAQSPFLVPAGGVTVATRGDSSQGVFGEVTRGDGHQQVAEVRSQYGAQYQIPLYFCAADQRPGDRECADQEDQWGLWLAYRP